MPEWMAVVGSWTIAVLGVVALWALVLWVIVMVLDYHIRAKNFMRDYWRFHYWLADRKKRHDAIGYAYERAKEVDALLDKETSTEVKRSRAFRSLLRDLQQENESIAKRLNEKESDDDESSDA